MPWRRRGPSQRERDPNAGGDERKGAPDEPFGIPWGPGWSRERRARAERWHREMRERGAGAPPWGPPWRRKRRRARRQRGLRRRLASAFAFVAMVAVSLTTVMTLGAVADLQRELSSAGPSAVGDAPPRFAPPWSRDHDAADRSDRGSGDHGDGPAVAAAFGRVTRTAFLAALLSFVLGAGAAAYIARRLTRPLVALTDGARRLAEGERGVRLTPPAERDELRTLTLAFNALVEGLERQEAWRRDLVADIAHDLRTPLSVLRSEIEALQDGVRPRDDAALARLHGEVMTLSRLIADLRTLSLAEGGGLELRRERLDGDALLRGLAASFRARADATGSEIAVASAPGWTVDADPTQLRRLLGNLLDNALRYAPGPVELGGRAAPGSDGAGGAELWVRDRGPGLSEEAQGRIFERFYRGDRARTRSAEGERGSGLGLAIARAIAEAHGGELTGGNVTAGEEGAEGGGARFAVRLPAAERIPDSGSS